MDFIIKNDVSYFRARKNTFIKLMLEKEKNIRWFCAVINNDFKGKSLDMNLHYVVIYIIVLFIWVHGIL